MASKKEIIKKIKQVIKENDISPSEIFEEQEPETDVPSIPAPGSSIPEPGPRGYSTADDRAIGRRTPPKNIKRGSLLIPNIWAVGGRATDSRNWPRGGLLGSMPAVSSRRNRPNIWRR